MEAKEERFDSAEDLIPSNPTIPLLWSAAKNCKACHLWKLGKQTVFGNGKPGAEVMLVGEQPGFHEDIEGKPFVGPAGQLLDRSLQAADINRNRLYVTNVVKHFKWKPKGKRHMHETPNAAEIAACRPWLEAEIALLKPQIIVCLGATAAKTLLGKDLRVTKDRGKLIKSPWAPYVFATVHPSSLLRLPDEEMRKHETKKFIADLRKIKEILDR